MYRERVANKFGKTGLSYVKSENIDAPIIEGCPLVIECELKDIINTTYFNGILAGIKNVLCNEELLNEKGKIDTQKMNMILYNSFDNTYKSLGDTVGKAFNEGKKFL